jgi:hypothetical protein
MEEPDLVAPLFHPRVGVHGHHIAVPLEVSRRAQMLPQLVDLMGQRFFCRGSGECPESGREEVRAQHLVPQGVKRGIGLDSAGCVSIREGSQ